LIVLMVISRARFAVLLAIIVVAGGLLRGVFLTADPPTQPTVGVVWHDEGAWVHNARNKALFGSWKRDEWNPMYITPVMTGLEYVSFEMFGVGLRQARVVPAALGVLSVLLLGLGVARIAGRLAGLLAAAFLATNYVWVMYGRAAVMEGTMVSLLVVAWYCCVRAYDSPRWGLAAGAAAFLAYFAKASGAFFVAAVGFDALLTIALTWRPAASGDRAAIDASTARRWRAGAVATLGGLVIAGMVSLVFLLPNWRQYWFYNWQISVTRKPSYAVRAFIDRVSWLPIVHDFFTRMWMAALLATGAALSMATRFGRVHPAERLLLWWLGLGFAELIVHDVGNERYFVFLIPAIVALAAIALGRDRRALSASIAQVPLRRALVAAPVVVFALYALIGPLARLLFLPEIHAGRMADTVRLCSLLATVATVLVYASWPRLPRWLARDLLPPFAVLAIAGVIVTGDLAQFGQWAAVRTYKNYEAMKLIGQWLPPGTVVHGKLANGLDLESRIVPVFVGRGFGNYDDRKTRDDIRYLLTYTDPFVGYEGPVIRDVLEAYPHWRILKRFDVAESPAGDDRAALVDKMPPGLGNRAPDAPAPRPNERPEVGTSR
jgi:4-amino-4-deoxy-L-arabinose transferase-like glycosyltransferase